MNTMVLLVRFTFAPGRYYITECGIRLIEFSLIRAQALNDFVLRHETLNQRKSYDDQCIY